MIRLGAWQWLLLAVAAGVGLFQVKYQVQSLEAELAGLSEQTHKDRGAIHVLRAEWSYLNEPQRLARFARRHLELAPITAPQLAAFDELPYPLPLPPDGQWPGDAERFPPLKPVAAGAGNTDTATILKAMQAGLRSTP